MDALLPIASEAASRAIDWSKALITSRIQQNKIKELIDDTMIRAAMAPSSMNLESKFRNTVLVEELLAHQVKMDVSRDDAVAIFLGENADDSARTFVAKFYDEVSSITDTESTSAASRRAANGIDKVLTILQNAGKESPVAQIVLLEEIAPLIGDGSIEVDRIHALSKTAGESLVGTYLEAYYALCTEMPVNESGLKQLSGNDLLIEALCSVAISARRFRDAGAIAQLFSFDANDLTGAIEKLAEKLERASEPIAVQIPDGNSIEGLIGLINFEYSYSLGAFSAADELASKAQITWNPLAQEKLVAASLLKSAMFENAETGEMAISFAGRFRPWFPQVIVKEYKFAISYALTTLDTQQALTVLSHIPAELDQFIQDEEKMLDLRSCDNATTAIEAIAWAEAHQNAELLLSASTRAIKLDEKLRDRVLKAYEHNLVWALPTPGALYLYAMKIDPEMSYDDFLKHGAGFENEAVFHLTAYSKFKESNPSESVSHIEKSLEVMRSPTSAPELLHSSIWVPYLVENDREDEVLELVEHALPLAPMNQLLAFLAAVSECENNSFLERVIDSIAKADYKDPASAEVIAIHLANRGDIELAGRIALKAFERMPSENLAEIAAQWMISSSLDVHDSIIRYAKRLDTDRMNLLMASIEHSNGSLNSSNSFLLRAAFGEGKMGSRALMHYALWNAGRCSKIPQPDSLEADCYAILRLPDDQQVSVIFLSDSHAVKTEGAHGLAGVVHSTSSSKFIEFRGHRPGDYVQIDKERAEILEIGNASSFLMKAGFAEIPNNEGGMAIVGSIDELFDKLAKASASNKKLESYYLEGIETASGTVYLGIETGGMLCPSRQLEFTIRAIINRSTPFRRAGTCKNAAFSKGQRFLLSYNAIIVLSLLDIPDEVSGAIRNCCIITSSTANRLRKEARTLADEPFTGAGRLSFDGVNPTFFEFNDDSQREITSMCKRIIELAESIVSIEPEIDSPDMRLLKALSDNEAMDISTSVEHDLVLVTEDLLEAQLIDALDIAKRCSLTGMLLCMQCAEYALGRFADRMSEWNAQPPIEHDVIEALLTAIRASCVAPSNKGQNHDGENDDITG